MKELKYETNSDALTIACSFRHSTLIFLSALALPRTTTTTTTTFPPLKAGGVSDPDQARLLFRGTKGEPSKNCSVKAPNDDKCQFSRKRMENSLTGPAGLMTLRSITIIGSIRVNCVRSNPRYRDLLRTQA